MREYEVDRNGGVACNLLNKKMSEKNIPNFLFNNQLVANYFFKRYDNIPNGSIFII